MGFCDLFVGHSKIAVLGLFCPYRPIGQFFAKFQLKISPWVFLVQKRSRYGKSSKIDILSENIGKKGFSHPKSNKNHRWQSPNFRILAIFGLCHLWFWVCWGCEQPFLPTFPEHLKNLKDFSYLHRFCTGWTRWNILTSNLTKKGHFSLLGENRRKMPKMCCLVQKCQKKAENGRNTPEIYLCSIADCWILKFATSRHS